MRDSYNILKGHNIHKNLFALYVRVMKKYQYPRTRIHKATLKNGFRHALLQGLTLISGTQTGCRRLDSYIEQKKFLACGPEFSVEFSAPPEFSGGVTEKFLSTGWARTFDLQITKQILYHCATAPLYLESYNIYVLVARIFRPFV